MMHALLLLAVVPPPAPAAEAPPVIAEVVVYPDRAAVTRRSTVSCRERAQVRFPHIPPGADPGSFRAQARGGSALALRSLASARTAAFSPRVAVIDRRLAQLETDVAHAQAALTRALAEADNGEAFRGITEQLVTRELTAVKPDVAAWRRALDTVLESGLKAARGRTPLDARLRELRREQQRLTAQRSLLSEAGARKDHQVDVELSCSSPGEVTVSLSYVVGGASWKPAYEARSDAAGGALELRVHATVEQVSGEDWRGARLTLSTARPSRQSTPPRIEPLAVFAERREPPEKRVVAWSEPVRHAEAARPSAAADAVTNTPVRAERQGASVQLTLPAPAHIPGDGTPVRLLVARHQLSAKLRLRASPRLAPYVFRLAEAYNAAPFALLPGPVDVYRAGSFVARHTLEETPPGGRFTVNLGADERLRTARLILEEREQKTGLFGKARDHRFHYRLTIESQLPAPEQVELVDQIPVSEQEDLKVILRRPTTPGYDLDRRDGLIRWTLRLSPNERRTAELAFHIEVPSDYR